MVYTWSGFQLNVVKAKPAKVINLTNHDSGRNERIAPIRTQSKYFTMAPSAGTACAQVTTSFGVSYWWGKWREFWLSKTKANAKLLSIENRSIELKFFYKLNRRESLFFN